MKKEEKKGITLDEYFKRWRKKQSKYNRLSYYRPNKYWYVEGVE